MKESSTNPYKVFHSTCGDLRTRLHVILCHPEQGGNVGSVARALENMGILGDFRLVGTPDILTPECRKMAVHAQGRLDRIRFFPTLHEALAFDKPERGLSLAATARVGSAERPHPLWVRPALERAVEKLRTNEITDLFLVFGSESDGLTNAEVALCDWVVTIPATEHYRSLNLAQAVLIFCYEANANLMKSWDTFGEGRPSQKQRLIQHVVRLAEEVGFILPGDPFKMRPRLEEIFSALPPHIKEVKTLHGLLDQVTRTVRKGRVDLKGRFKQFGV